MPAHARLKQHRSNIIFILSNKNELTTTQIDQLLNEQPKLVIIYEALCIRLLALLKECKNDPQSKILKTCLDQTLEEATTLNKQLRQLYIHTGNHKSAQERLKIHAQKFKALKNPSSPLKKASKPDRLSKLSFLAQFFMLLQFIRDEISLKNIYRLFIARLRRYFLNIKTALEVFSTNSLAFKSFFEPFDKYLFGPVMNYLSWLFLLPRLIANLILLPWHVIRSPSLTPGENKLTWKQRFLIQWRERWFELANDLIWVPGGILTCFFLVGPLNMVGLILGVAMFSWDIVLSITRAVIELSRLNQLIHEHTEQLETLADPIGITKLSAFIEQLKAYRSYERKRHALSIVNNTLVTLLSFLAVSIIILPIVVPIVASSLLLILTVVFFYLNARINNSKPQSKLEDLDTTSYDKIWQMTTDLKSEPVPSPFPHLHYSGANYSSFGSSSALMPWPNEQSSDFLLPPAQSPSPFLGK
jgi:hypothetical protein